MKLVNLKSDSGDSSYSPMPMEAYGYGLRLCLDNKACEKLGITKAMAPGTRVSIKAEALVCSSTSSIDDGDDDVDVRLSLQITDMGIESQGMVRNAAQVLYGNVDKSDD
jgi:hypothetical protein